MAFEALFKTMFLQGILFQVLKSLLKGGVKTQSVSSLGAVIPMRGEN